MYTTNHIALKYKEDYVMLSVTGRFIVWQTAVNVSYGDALYISRLDKTSDLTETVAVC
jgi:hypothetical protein